MCVSYDPVANIVTDMLYVDRVAIKANMTLQGTQDAVAGTNPMISIPAIGSAVSPGVGICDAAMYLSGLPMHCRFEHIASGSCDIDTGICTIRATRESDGAIVRVGLQHSHNESYAVGVGCTLSTYKFSTGHVLSVPCATAHQKKLLNAENVDVMLSVHDNGRTNTQYDGKTVTLYRSRNTDDDDMPNIVFIASLLLVLTTFLPATMAVNQDDGATTRDSATYIRKVRVLVFDMSTSITVCTCYAVYTGASYSMFDANTERYYTMHEMSIIVFLLMQLMGSAIIARVILADMLYETTKNMCTNNEDKQSFKSWLLGCAASCLPNVVLNDQRLARPDSYILLRQAFECQVLTAIHAFIPGEVVNRLKALFGVLLGTACLVICGRDFAKLGNKYTSFALSIVVAAHCSINMFLPMLDIADSHALETHSLSLFLPISLAFHGLCAGVIAAYIQAENTTIQTNVSLLYAQNQDNGDRGGRS
jgi:hypothetical protein